MDPTPASREAVMAWMASTGMGYRKAAEHFSIQVETVKSWVKREKERLTSLPQLPPTKPTAPQLPPSAPQADDDAPPALLVALEPITPAERERRLLVAIDARLHRLADPRSVGMRGEQGAAVATGVLIDKLKVLRELHGLGFGSEEGGRSDPDGVLEAMGFTEGPESG